MHVLFSIELLREENLLFLTEATMQIVSAV